MRTYRNPVDEEGEALLSTREVAEIFGRSIPYIDTLIGEGLLTPRTERGARGGRLFSAKEAWSALNKKMPGLAALLAKKQKEKEEEKEAPKERYEFPEILEPRKKQFENVEAQILPDIPKNIADVEQTIELNEKKRMVPESEQKETKTQKPYSTNWISEVAELMCYGYEVDSCKVDEVGRPKFLFTETDQRFWRIVDEWQTGVSPHRIFDNKLKEVRTMLYQSRN